MQRRDASSGRSGWLPGWRFLTSFVFQLGSVHYYRSATRRSNPARANRRLSAASRDGSHVLGDGLRRRSFRRRYSFRRQREIVAAEKNPLARMPLDSHESPDRIEYAGTGDECRLRVLKANQRIRFPLAVRLKIA